MHQVVIVGGGPAGLFCALRAAGGQRRVVVLEKKPSCGRKLLITGSGQCNITHEGEISAFFDHYGDHGRYLRSALRTFSNRDLIAFFEARGLRMTEEGGKVFPASRKASDVLAVLLEECAAKGVEIRCREPVQVVRSTDAAFSVQTPLGTYRADTLVLACGGTSYPATGSSGDGYTLARQLGHTVTEIAPALAPLVIRDYPFPDLAGISFENLSISLFRDNRKIRQHAGDLLLTHSGLSGPGILDISRYVLPGDILRISFLPGRDREGLTKDLVDRIAEKGHVRVKTLLSRYGLPDRFLRRLLEVAGVPADTPSAQLSKAKRTLLVTTLLGHPFSVQRLGGWNEAMVTRGGVTLAEIDPGTLESKRQHHLYCIGEMLDIDGDTGGYNLQAAFSTAAAAARHIAVMPDV